MTSRPKPPDRDRVRRAVMNLQPIQREVLMLSAADGLSNEVIATRLGLDVDEVRRHLADAMVALDRALNPPRRSWWRR